MALSDALVPEELTNSEVPADISVVADESPPTDETLQDLPEDYMQPADVPTPSSKGAKFLKYNPDGSALLESGGRQIRYFKQDGHIEWDMGGKTYASKGPMLKPVIISSAPKTASELESLTAETAAKKGILRSAYPPGQEGDALYQKARAGALNATAGVDDISQGIADAIISGNQPPELKGMYRHGPGIRKALQDKGYNLTDATLDWESTKKHIATLEGPQQLRMRQAIDNAYHSLDVIDDLSGQWDAGQFPLLTKVRLESAKQGVLGPKAQAIAVQLEAQIADVTSELGNVYMGGNSPTDQSLKLAQNNLSASWSKSTLKSATDLARKNLTIRDNSIKNSGTSRAGNRYDQQAPVAQPAAAPSSTPPPAQYPVGTKARKGNVWHTMTENGWEPPL